MIDEFGRPIILFDPEETKKRIKGMEAYKVIYQLFLINLNYFSIILPPLEESPQSSRLP